MANKAASLAPNSFRLRGETIEVNYSTTSLDGKPRLTYKKGRTTLNFSGNQIESLTTDIGTEVNVVIGNVADESTTRFSVLLPAIRLPESKRQAFKTFGITTVTKTTITGPPVGVQQTYRTVPLRGSAQLVTS